MRNKLRLLWNCFCWKPNRESQQRLLELVLRGRRAIGFAKRKQNLSKKKTTTWQVKQALEACLINGLLRFLFVFSFCLAYKIIKEEQIEAEL